MTLEPDPAPFLFSIVMDSQINIYHFFSFMNFFQQFDAVIQAVKEGKEVDLSNMPKFPTCK